jgi:hypothetical protein
MHELRTARKPFSGYSRFFAAVLNNSAARGFREEVAV